MDFKNLKWNWDMFGRTNAMGAILTSRGDWDEEAFFESGLLEIEQVMAHARSLGMRTRFHQGLDFGCGVGRLTQALAHYCDSVCGVDIAESMVTLATKSNRHGDKCRYHLIDTDDLQLFDDNSFDLVYSNITLQHMEPSYSKSYIKRILRIFANSVPRWPPSVSAARRTRYWWLASPRRKTGSSSERTQALSKYQQGIHF